MSNFLKDRVAPNNYLQVAAPPQDLPEEEVGFGDALGAAVTLTSPTQALQSLATESRIKPDPSYRLDFDAAKEGVPEYAWPMLAKALEDSRSLEHTDYIKNKLVGELEQAEQLQAYTGGSTLGNIGMTLAASALDPINLAVGVGTAGLGLAATAGMHGARLSRVKRAMTIAGMEGAANAAIELPLYYANKTSTPEDILWAAAFGATLGGVVGAVAPPKMGTLAKRAYDAERANAERTMDRMAEVEAAEIAGAQAPVQEIPADFMRMMAKDPMVRKPRAVEPEAPARFGPGVDELEAKLKELNERTLPDEPVQVKTREGLDGFREELDFIKKLPEMRLSAKDTTQAKIEFNRAKGRFVEEYRDADPEGFQQIFGNRDRLNPPTEELEKALPAIEKRIAKLEKQYETDLASYKRAVDTLGTQKDELLDALELARKVNPEAEAPAPAVKSVGAAEAERGGIELSKLTEEELDDLFDPDTPVARQFRVKGVPLRYDLAGQMDRSPNVMTADAGRKLFQDAIAKEGHVVNPESATELAEMWRDTVMTIYNSEANAAFNDWAKAKGYPTGATAWFRDPRGYARAEFEELVTEAVESGHSVDPHVAKAAKTFADMTERVYEIGEAYLPGFKDFPQERNYVPRQWNNEKLQHLNSEYAVDPADLSEGVDSILGELIYRGIMQENPTYDPALTAKISNNVAQRFIERSTSVDFEYPDFGKLTREKLEEMFDAVDIPRVDRDNFFKGLDTQYAQEDAGRVSHAKQRMAMKIDHEPLRVRYTGDSQSTSLKMGDTVELQLKDVFTRRADALLHGYVNQIAGYGALSKVTGGKVHNDSTVKSWMADIKKYEQTYGDDLERVDKEIRKLMIGVNHTLGRALEDPNTQIAHARRILNGWNFMRVMNQAVFPQYSESSKIITATSLKTVSHYAPRVANAFKLMRAGEELPDDVKMLVLAARDYGIGGSFTRGGTVVGRYQSDIDGTMFSKYDRSRRLIEHLKRPTAGMLQFALDQQEVLTFMSMTAEWGQRAKGLKQFTKSDYQRFAWMGIDKPMVNRISKQMMRHAKGEDGKPWAVSDSKFIADLNFREWDDYVARDKYGFGMKRRIGETIQTNNPGNLPEWSQKNLGAIIAQFRSFPIAAHHKQLLHGVSMNDMQAYMTFAANSMFSALARAGQVYLNSLGREDAEEYRNRYMSPEMLAYAAFERSAWSGVSSMTTIPAHVYKAMTGEYPGSMRSTGLDRGLGGVPAVDVINRVMQTPDALGKMLTDGDVQGAFRNIWGFMPYSNMPGLKNAAAAIADNLPE